METIELEHQVSPPFLNETGEGEQIAVSTTETAATPAVDEDGLLTRPHEPCQEASNLVFLPFLNDSNEGGGVRASTTEPPTGGAVPSVLQDDSAYSLPQGAHEERPEELSTLKTESEDSVHIPITAAPVPTPSPKSLSERPTLSGVPQQKRFSAVNINKKFLEKNSTSSSPGMGHISSGGTSGKQSGVIARPTPQSASSFHSRLVTAKLTGTPLSSNAPGQGWSRPNSATPPAATSSSSSILSGNNPTPAGASSSQGAPQVPAVGKVIQPQARSALKPKDGLGGSGKPAWGNVQSASVEAALRAQNDFPTAAEAAKGPVVRVPDVKVAAEVAAQKQARLETADAFRGVHLDPNAHHWDEMEEDDNDFLDGVIEFGDGTQYKIQVDESAALNAAAAQGSVAETISHPNGFLPPDRPVSKEERFADDFDRSWPRSRTNHDAPVLQDAPKNQVLHPMAPVSVTSMMPSGPAVPSHDPSHARVLFNERLNRMEPYSNGNRPNGTVAPQSVPHIALRRGSNSEATSPTDPRRGRDLPPHALAPNVQVLQKSGAAGSNGSIDEGMPLRNAWSTGEDKKAGDVSAIVAAGLPSSLHVEKPRERQRGRRDSTAMLPPPVPLTRVQSRESDRNRRDHYNPMGLPIVPPGGRDRPFHVGDDQRGRHASTIPTGAMPLPRPTSSNRDRSRDTGRQLPPHLSDMPPPPPPPARRLSSRDTQPDSDLALRTRSPSMSSAASAHLPSHSFLSSHMTTISPASDKSLQNLLPVPDATDVGDVDVQKVFLQVSAERAKQRRQQQEEEMVKAQDRAKKKAAELAPKAAVKETVMLQGEAKEVEKVQEPPKLQTTESEVLNILEDAVKQAPSTQSGIPHDPSEAPSQSGIESVSKQSSWTRPPSNQPVDRRTPIPSPLPALTRRPSYLAPSTSSQADSWRSKANPLPASTPPSNTDQAKPPTLLPPALPEAQSFDLQPGEELEVVDFSELGRLVRDTEKPDPVLEPAPLDNAPASRPQRPVASDFFDDGPTTRDSRVSILPEPEYWRRRAHPSTELLSDMSLSTTVEQLTPSKGPISLSKTPEDGSTQQAPNDTGFQIMESDGTMSSALSHPPSPPKKPWSSTEIPSSPSWPGQTVHVRSSIETISSPSWLSQSVTVPPMFGTLRSPRTPSAYREAPMSALNDTMSRIKGALDGMQVPLAIAGETNETKSALGPVVHTQEPVASSSRTLLVPIGPVPTRAFRSEPQVFGAAPRSEFSPRRETFEITHPEPPSTPLPLDSMFTIRLPSKSRALEPLPKKQHHLCRVPPESVRWDILSWNPPVEGMTRRNLSVNDVLFRKPTIAKNKFRFRVALPKTSPTIRKYGSIPFASSYPLGPKVNMPAGALPDARLGATGAFGRPKVAENSSWRRGIDPAATSEDSSGQALRVELNVTSRSPPPEPPSHSKLDSGNLKLDLPLPTKPAPVKSKTLKMPAGADVAFYRDLRKDAEGGVGTTRSVSFTVISELEMTPEDSTFNTSAKSDIIPAAREERSKSSVTAQSVPSSSSTLIESSHELESTEPLSSKGSVTVSSKLGLQLGASRPAMIPSKTESNGSEETRSSLNQTERSPVTPPPQSSLSPWGKSSLAFALRESPARAPDPEHLKAVWSQASDKKSIPAVNSLKGIADDLTAVPFTLQEVKSEDGGTPPPAASAPPPSRMSASEVTRAFQTVPAGPGNSSSPMQPRNLPFAPPMSSPNNGHPGPRTPGAHLPQPAAAPSMRPPFPGYPSPMTSHSPSPTLMYSHHPPNGTPPHPYGQPMWMPVSGHMPQQSPQMMRPQPSPSPYNPQLLPYPPAGAPSSMYAVPTSQPGAQNPPGHYVNGAHPRMALVSPVMAPATTVHHMPMYAASPILVHAPPHSGTPPAQTYPAAVGMGRGVMPVRNNSYDNRQSLPVMQQQAPPGVRFPNHNPGYTHVPPTSFVRPTW